MTDEKRTPHAVHRTTPKLETLLAQFSDEEISSGVVASGAALPRERQSVDELVEQLNKARRPSRQE